MTPHQPPIPTPDEIVEAMARGIHTHMTTVPWDALSNQSKLRACDAIRAALRALPPGVVLVAGVPDGDMSVRIWGEYVEVGE